MIKESTYYQEFVFKQIHKKIKTAAKEGKTSITFDHSLSKFCANHLEEKGFEVHICTYDTLIFW